VRHLEYAAFVADPFKAVSELYAHFDLPLGNAAGARIRAFLAERPNGRYGHNPTRLEDYGLSAAALREAYRPYTDHFAIAAETKTPGAARGKTISPRFAGVAAK
jgi:hypothetical protein